MKNIKNIKNSISSNFVEKIPGSGIISMTPLGIEMKSSKINTKNGITSCPEIEHILNEVKLIFYIEPNLSLKEHPDNFVWEYYIENQIKKFERVVVRQEERQDKIGIYMYKKKNDHKQTCYYKVHLKSLRETLKKIISNKMKIKQ